MLGFSGVGLAIDCTGGAMHKGPPAFRGSGGARGHPDRGSSFPDRGGGAEVSAGSTLFCKLPPPYFVALHIL